MTNSELEISSGRTGHTGEQLSGLVYLGQKRNEWPVALMENEKSAMRYLKEPGAYVWVYEIRPVKRVELIEPAPYLIDAAQAEAAP